jgi:Beta-lactamase
MTRDRVCVISGWRRRARRSDSRWFRVVGPYQHDDVAVAGGRERDQHLDPFLDEPDDVLSLRMPGAEQLDQGMQLVRAGFVDERGVATDDAIAFQAIDTSLDRRHRQRNMAERRLSLTDPVHKWLPGLVANDRAITVRMLLSHTSGLPDYSIELHKGRFDPDVLRSITGQDRRVWTPRQLLPVAARYPVNFAPGAQYSYSNTNYIALGLILERISGTASPIC